MTQPPYDRPDIPETTPVSPVDPRRVHDRAEPDLDYDSALPPVAQPAPAKKSTAWLTVLIVVLAALLVVVVGILVLRHVMIGNRDTAYCQTYISLSDELPDISTRLGQAQATGDLSEVSSALDEMITAFEDLQGSTPPDSVAAPLDTIIDYLTDLKGYADADDPDGYNAYVTANATTGFQDPAAQVDDASVEYCN